MHEGHRLHETHIANRGVDPAGAFSVERVESADGVAIIALGGELDIAATDAMRRLVDDAAGRRGLVLDLAETTFIDSSVLKELLRANTEMARYDTRVVLADVPPPVQRLLDLTRAAQLFAIAADRASALREFDKD